MIEGCERGWRIVVGGNSRGWPPIPLVTCRAVTAAGSDGRLSKFVAGCGSVEEFDNLLVGVCTDGGGYRQCRECSPGCYSTKYTAHNESPDPVDGEVGLLLRWTLKHCCRKCAGSFGEWWFCARICWPCPVCRFHPFKFIYRPGKPLQTNIDVFLISFHFFKKFLSY